jgi:glutathione synthase/RimK-type ligase-like ATP-grasp enzyme
LILLAGLPDEGPLARVAAALDRIGAPFVTLDQRDHAAVGLRVVPAGPGGEPEGELRVPGARVPLASVRGIYNRMHGAASFPDLASLPPDDPRRRRLERLTATLTGFADVAPGVVFNRSAAMATNASKGLQAQLIRAAGFEVPETLITNDPEQARDFVERAWSAGRQVVFKSASSVRSIVRAVRREDFGRLGALRFCPVQFQLRVEGVDHRVHVVGDRAFATRIETTGADYRYAAREAGGRTALAAAQLPAPVTERCVRAAAALGLGFAGVDLRRTPAGDWVCFEINPSPAFSYFEDATGQPIAEAVARRLAGVG